MTIAICIFLKRLVSTSQIVRMQFNFAQSAARFSWSFHLENLIHTHWLCYSSSSELRFRLHSTIEDKRLKRNSFNYRRSIASDKLCFIMQALGDRKMRESTVDSKVLIKSTLSCSISCWCSDINRLARQRASSKNVLRSAFNFVSNVNASSMDEDIYSW